MNVTYYSELLREPLEEPEAWQHEHRYGDLILAWAALINCLAIACRFKDGRFCAGDVFRILEMAALVKGFGAGKTTLGQGMCKALGVSAIRTGLVAWVDSLDSEADIEKSAKRRHILTRILALVPEGAAPSPGGTMSFCGMEYLYVDYRREYAAERQRAREEFDKRISLHQNLLVHLDEVGELEPEKVGSLRAECARMIEQAMNAGVLVFFLWTGRSLEKPDVNVSFPRASRSTLFQFIDVKPLTVEQIQVVRSFCVFWKQLFVLGFAVYVHGLPCVMLFGVFL